MRSVIWFLSGSLLLTMALSPGCKKKEPPGPPATELIAQSPPNVAARALRDEVLQRFAAGQLDEAAKKLEGMPRLVGEVLASMDAISHQKSAVPDFGVIRYIEALRDLGENLRGFERLYSPNNPVSLKKDMLQGVIEQLKLKLR